MDFSLFQIKYGTERKINSQKICAQMCMGKTDLTELEHHNLLAFAVCLVHIQTDLVIIFH